MAGRSRIGPAIRCLSGGPSVTTGLYTRLKKQLGGPPTRRQRRPTEPAFVEFIAPGRTTPEECVIEFESAGGSKMRIQWKSTAPPDWTNLLRAWRDAER